MECRDQGFSKSPLLRQNAEVEGSLKLVEVF